MIYQGHGGVVVINGMSFAVLSWELFRFRSKRPRRTKGEDWRRFYQALSRL